MDRLLNRMIKLILGLFIFILIIYLFPKMKDLIIYILVFLLPFIVSFIIAFVFNPLVDFFEKKKIKRIFTSFFIVLLIVLILVGFIVLLIPTITKEITKLIENLPTYIDNLNNIIDKVCIKVNLDSTKFKLSTTKILELIDTNFNSFIQKFVKIFQSIFSYFTTFGITIVLTLYFLVEYHKIIESIKKIIIEKKKEDVIPIFEELDYTLRAYFRGVIIIMIIMSVISMIAFRIMGLELSLLWGIIIGFTNIIPYVGPLIGGLIVGIFVLGTNPIKLIPVIIYIIIIQFIESNFITPQIESKCVKSHPIILIFFVTLLGNIFGLMGMLLAVPVLSIIQTLIKHKKNN